jgi:hypothetical protein
MGGELEVAVSDAQRQAALDHLRQSVATSNLGLEVYSDAVAAVLAASTAGEVAGVLERISPVARLTPPHRRHDEPVVLEVRSGRLDVGPSWQVPRTTRVAAGSGRVLLDLTDAEFDAPIVDFDLSVQSGSISVVVPHGIDVQFVEMAGHSGSVRNELGPGAALPGSPLVRVRARTTSGRVIVRRPEEPGPAQARRRWFRRRRSTASSSG